MNYECPYPECERRFERSQQLYGHIGGLHSKRLLPISHGTEWGYQQHGKRDIRPCEACKRAHRIRLREWRRKSGIKTQLAKG